VTFIYLDNWAKVKVTAAKGHTSITKYTFAGGLPLVEKWSCYYYFLKPTSTKLQARKFLKQNCLLARAKLRHHLYCLAAIFVGFHSQLFIVAEFKNNSITKVTL